MEAAADAAPAPPRRVAAAMLGFRACLTRLGLVTHLQQPLSAWPCRPLDVDHKGLQNHRPAPACAQAAVLAAGCGVAGHGAPRRGASGAAVRLPSIPCLLARLPPPPPPPPNKNNTTPPPPPLLPCPSPRPPVDLRGLSLSSSRRHTCSNSMTCAGMASTGRRAKAHRSPRLRPTCARHALQSAGAAPDGRHPACRAPRSQRRAAPFPRWH